VSELYHSVVWIDHHEARVFYFDSDHIVSAVIHPANPAQHLHHKANSTGSGHGAEDQKFYHAVVAAIGDAGAILIMGPANAKQELVKHMEHHAPAVRAHVVAVETLQRQTDGELVAHARKYFRAEDRMTAQRAP
jgi:stalled ribosome rescue protein Dom34